MMHNKALVTLVIGKRYLNRWQVRCQVNWQQYAERHHYDLIVIDTPLDTSARAVQRSPAWQKCLILGEERVKRYERVVWIDSDIFINPAAPSIVDQVPEDRVGAVEWSAGLTHDEFELLLDRQQAYWKTPVLDRSAQDYYARFGLPPSFDEVVQTGVLVLSPHRHQSLLEAVYNHYEDKGSNEWHYEMRPLSYELLKANCVHWIDHRFNAIWFNIKCLHYPFLLRHSDLDYRLPVRLRRRLEETLKLSLHYRAAQMCITTAFLNNYFLHFAGSMLDMRIMTSQNETPS